MVGNANHIHLIIELGEYNYNNGIANGDDDNVVDGGNVEESLVYSSAIDYAGEKGLLDDAIIAK